MTAITLASPFLPGNFIRPPSTKDGEYLTLMGYKIVDAYGFARISTAGGIAFNVVVAPSEFVPYTEGAQLTIPSGAMVIRSAIKIPTGLVATNGDVIRFGGAVAAANVAGTNVAIESAVAASTTFAAASVVSQAPIGAFLGVSSASTALAADLDLQILSVTPGSPDVAGNAISAAAGSNNSELLIPCHIVYALADPEGPAIELAYPQTRGRTTDTNS